MRTMSMKIITGLLTAVSCLSVISCSFPQINVCLVNQTSTTVKISYSHIGLKIQNSPLCYDTVRYEVEPGKSIKIFFPVICRNKRVSDNINKLLPFVIFESPDKVICFDETDELIKLLEKRTERKNEYEFLITDSLFNQSAVKE